ncbi:SulP family inorganic anion transporter [Methylocella tundrae]|nr:SulP family inorganic anion transporter [Methylocella tundrae]
MRAFFARRSFADDLLASVVVFLVALPLCMGIAIASGMPAASGLITGIVGGLVVGFLAGSPLQVSGPAAGLAVLVFELVRTHGVAALGPVVLLAGLIQIGAGLFRVGVWFRMTSPAVVYGMLAGIGILIVASQLHVLVDAAPRASGLDNLLAIPEALLGAGAGDGLIAGSLGLATIGLMLAWEKLRPAALRALPGALIAVVVIAGLAETLLSAAAVDRMHDGPRTQYDRELAAQGVGNAICGALGALPMTGVIVRSAANVQAGAKTRASAILHGAWILAFALLAPGLLRSIPVSCLAGILVYTGFKMLSPAHLRQLRAYGYGAMGVYAATAIAIVATDLLTGVLVGFALSLFRLSLRSAALDVRLVDSPKPGEARLHLDGAATFLKAPALANALDRVPADTVLHVVIDRLTHIDHAALELLRDWGKNAGARGCALVVD